jgi:hypothetical protein
MWHQGMRSLPTRRRFSAQPRFGFFNVLRRVVAILKVAVGITDPQPLSLADRVDSTFNGSVLIVALAVSMLAPRRSAAGGLRLLARRAQRKRSALTAGDGAQAP